MDIDQLQKTVLLGLYEHRINGGFITLNSFFKAEDGFNRHQSKLIFDSLSEKGLIKGRVNSSGHIAEITFEGIKYVETNIFKEDYKTYDLFTEKERNVIIDKLDDLAHRISKMELGQQVIYDDIVNELQSLKETLKVLNKKDWKSFFKGKMVDLGLGEIYDSAKDVVIEVFKDTKLLQ